MTTQALPSWDAEMQRQITATTVAQYRIVELEGQLNALRDILSTDSATVAGQTLVEALRAVVAARDTFQAAHRMAEQHVAELLLARSAADREVGAMIGTIDQAIANLRAIVALNDAPHIDEICRATADALGALLGEKAQEGVE